MLNKISDTKNKFGSGSTKTPYKSPFDKFVPYAKRTTNDKFAIKQNLKGLGNVSHIGGASTAVKHFIGSISISNQRALNIPKGVHKLDACLCTGKNHQFLYLCDTFKKLSTSLRNKTVIRLGVCKICLLKHSEIVNSTIGTCAAAKIKPISTMPFPAPKPPG